ncbi:hypothetical protein N7471_006423 [Penicillium samsonianum]|uniref:uncharacterized protein n=1 Tax=Penicillium samsonianum TaxID=1882272 RepID=UPI002546F2C3|nr:uncharacterized protein N7471_006423 [Penicillium samsonianum]KAJ6139937.1 hypothetical protein N7471_006423 [Penicillium samsonianum]
MAEALAILGGVAAGMQMVSVAAQALLTTIKLVKSLKEVPEKLARLLNEVDDSISRLCHSCNTGSKFYLSLDPAQTENLSRCASMLFPALQDIHNKLIPLTKDSQSRAKPIHRIWKTFLSLKVEKELVEKLERLNRLNIEVVRELGVIGLEMQSSTHGLLVAGNAASSQGLSNIEAQMNLMRSDFQDFTVSVRRIHAVTVDTVAPGSDSSETASISGSTITSQTPQEEKRLSQERAEQMRSYLTGVLGGGAATKPTMGLNSQLPTARLEFMLVSIRTFYTPGNFDASSKLIRAAFWKDTDLAIYFMKISKGEQRGASHSKTRGLQLLKNTTTKRSNTIDEGTASILIELLSTLSPLNTATCSYVREGMLQHLSQVAREKLPRDHPIALVINKLRDDEGDEDVSLRALTFIAERLRATLGPTHELTELATKRLCALLRRSKRYDEALRVANDGVCAIRALLGPGSLQERSLSRQLEHVYMDQCDWTAALSVCFDIVGQRQLDSPNPDPLYHDECAVHTMEDIAKICELGGNMGQAVAWLKQALISGGMTWEGKEPVALSHIHDKLAELLKQMGKEEELELWNTFIEPMP